MFLSITQYTINYDLILLESLAHTIIDSSNDIKVLHHSSIDINFIPPINEREEPRNSTTAHQYIDFIFISRHIFISVSLIRLIHNIWNSYRELPFDLMSISHICDVVPERSSIKESLFISRSKDVPWPSLICILGLDRVPYLI